MLKVLFAGTPDVAVPSLKMLAEDTERFEVVAVLTRPDAPTGRGRKLVPNPVKQAALDLGLPVIESDPSEETFISELAATGAQAAAVVAYGKILKQDVLDALPMGWYNLHFSLLPQWRGAAPVQRSIWAGEKVTGATVFRIVRAMDAGPILAQSTVEIGAHETAGELLNRLAEDGSRLLAASLQAMADDQIAPVEQPAGAYEVAQKITVEDAHIRFDIPVFAVDRQIRACTPNPGAWCELHANAEAEPATLHVLRAQGADMSNPNTPVSLEPGRIVAGKRTCGWVLPQILWNCWKSKPKAKSHACRRLGAWRASRRSLLQVVSNKRIITILPCEHHHFTRQYRYPAISDFAISRLGSIGIRIIEECESTKKIKNPGQITFVHTMRSIRLNRRLGAERHAKPGGMNHRQIIGSIANRNSLTHADAHARSPITQ